MWYAFAAMPPERRKYVRRKPDAGMTVTAMSSTAVGAGATSARTNVAVKLIDVCDKGACIVTSGRLRVGAELSVRFFMSGTDDLYGAHAVVRWAQTWTKEGREADLAGLEFMKVTELRGTRFRSMASWAGELPTADGERRKMKRRLLETSKVHCVATGLFSLLGMSSNIAISLSDLSEGGCQIVASKKLEEGAKVKFTLSFQNPTVEIHGTGEVKWCKRDTLSLEPRYGLGLSFGDLANTEQGRLMMVLRAMDAVEK